MQCWLIGFFFFKQKTAYEMRISDWSSDVCSSDLKRLLKLRNLIRIKAGPGSETDKRVDRVSVLAELEVEHEDRLYPTPDAFPEVEVVIQQIGSASCRERVCQYV